MLTISFIGKPKPKPAGCLKYANGRAYISMNQNGYKDWQLKTVLEMKKLKISLTYPYGIIYILSVPNLQGLGDITNIMEALQDCLVQAKIIEDDRPSIIKNVSVSLKVNKDNNTYQNIIHLCYDKEDYLLTINRTLE